MRHTLLFAQPTGSQAVDQRDHTAMQLTGVTQLMRDLGALPARLPPPIMLALGVD